MGDLWFSGIHLLGMVGGITLGLLILGKIADLAIPFYRKQIDKETTAERFHSIDGMRGFLAIGVMFHHCVINYYLRVTTGKWEAPPSNVALMFGQIGVAMFFMVTAFLFWNRALTTEGNIDIRKFFWSRIMRMFPMYCVAALLLVYTAVWMCSFNLNVPLWLLGRQTIAWLSFTAIDAPDVNGLHDTGLINTVFWSLRYEWAFYLAFPILTLFAKGRVAWAAWFACLALVWMFSATNYEWYFVFGALAALLNVHAPWIKKLCQSTLSSVVVVAMLVLTVKTANTAYIPHAAVLLFIAFLIIANGNTMFGILTLRPARVLGLISYSVYLLHNWVISTGSWLIGRNFDLKTLSPLEYWALTGCFSVSTILLALVTYRVIEFPFLGLRLPSWVSASKKVSADIAVSSR